MSETQNTESQGSPQAEDAALELRVAEGGAEEDRLQSELSATRALLENAERSFLQLLLNVPAGIVVLRGQNLVAEVANARYLAIMGHRDIIGKPLQEAAPELMDQGLIDLLVQVYRTGEPLHGKEVPFKVARDGSGTLVEGWFDFVCQPMRDAAGLVASVLCHVTDVTDKVLARRKVEALNEELRLFKRMVDSALDGIGFISPEGTLTYANPALAAMSGLGDRIVGSPVSALCDPEVFESDVRPLMTSIYEEGTWSGILQAQRPDGTPWLAHISANVLRRSEGAEIGVTGIFRDVTAQRRQEQELAELQRHLIESQQAALRELATPLIPLAEGVIAMPLVGAIDTDRAQQILETLLQGISAQSARIALLDVTGVRTVDTQVANALIRSAQAAQLLGAEVVLTGLGPAVARTLVDLGVELAGIHTSGSLQSGIAYALRRLRVESKA
jgi:PAS domain S-box-containing protein